MGLSIEDISFSFCHNILPCIRKCIGNLNMINIYKCFEINLKTVIVDAKGRLQKKRENVGILKKQGGGLPKSQFFCKLTKCFLACQNHSEVLKHVLQ